MINLGKSSESAGMIEMVSAMPNEKMTYPSLYISGREGIEDAPDVGTEGEATIRFRVVSKTESEGPNGKNSSLDLEVVAIEFGEVSEDSEDEIEKGLRESEKETDDEEEE
jgi:hypothetical protein